MDPIPTGKTPTQAEMSLVYGGKPLDILMDPWMPTNLQWHMLKASVPAICRAAALATERFIEEPGIRAMFGYSDFQVRCILAEPGYSPRIPLGRLDCSLSESSLKFYEFNTDGTAGWHYCSALQALARGRLGLKPERNSLPQRLLMCLISCFRQWDEKGIDNPRMAIVDWEGVATRPEQEALAAFFRSLGHDCALEDPRTLIVRDGKLLGKSGPIDLVYRRAVSEELFGQPERVGPFIEAYLDNLACYVGSFRTDPAWSKALFAVLWDPDFQAGLPDEVRAAVKSSIPQTFLVNGGRASFGGDAGEMGDLLIRRREELVLKPAKAYGGAGVSVGRLFKPDDWKRLVQGTIKTGGWVAQEYVPLPAPPVSKVPDTSFFHAGAFVLGGQIAGLMARITDKPVLGEDCTEIWLPAEMPPE